MITEGIVSVRRARELSDYCACVELQKEVWSLSTADDMVSHIASTAVLKIANEHGGSVLIAHDPSGQIVGFSFAMLGPEMWWSHMTAVKAEYRNHNVGLLLKMRQRRDALEAGIETIQWTFDPLQALNAHFNFSKLGVVVRRYEENAYGTTASALHYGMPTDRFTAEWNLNSESVRYRMEGSGSSVIFRDLDRLARINTSVNDARLDLDDEQLTLEIPADIRRVPDPRSWQKMLAEVCQHYFAKGYIVTDFIKLDSPAPRAFYLLSHTVGLL